MNQILLKSPAKLNLYLKVINRREDGFHNIETLFERIDLCDSIIVKNNRTNKIRVTCDHPQVPCGPKNLVYQVARMIREDYGIDKGVDIDIRKRIPVAAGLAGGSSNAATVINALDRLWQLHMTSGKKFALARKIGSDVAFFLKNASWAVGMGRGDVLRPVSIGHKLWHVVVVPKRKLYARDVYGAMKFSLTNRGDNVSILIRNLKRLNIHRINSCMINDLEIAVFHRYPALRKLKQRLKSFATQGVMVSGSGPAVFGITDSLVQARKIQKELSGRFSQVYVVRTL